MSRIAVPTQTATRPIAIEEDRRALTAIAIGLAAMVISSLLSEGVYHEDDLKHFLYARWVQHDWRYLLDWWGRPGFTALYALPSMIGSPELGMLASRFLSAGLTGATAWLAYDSARRLELRHAWLAAVFVFAQPMVVLLSRTTLTEVPLAFYFALATWLLIRRMPLGSALIIALAPLTRHEAIVIWPVYWFVFWRMRVVWYCYPAVLWALVAQNLVYYGQTGVWPFEQFLRPNGTDFYGHGTLLTYVPKLFLACGPIVTVLAIMGVRTLWQRRMGWLIVVAPFFYIVVQTGIYLVGAYASGGYARFLVPIAPWMALLACGAIQKGWPKADTIAQQRTVGVAAVILAALALICQVEWLLKPLEIDVRWQSQWTMARLGLLAATLVFTAIGLLLIKRSSQDRTTRTWKRASIAVFAVVQCVMLVWAVWPLQLTPQQKVLAEVARTLDQLPYQNTDAIIVNYWVYYWNGDWVPQRPASWESVIEEAEQGTLFVWDARFCPEPPLSIAHPDELRTAGWTLEAAFANNSDQPRLLAAILKRR